jgi:hypothetical protein
MNPRRLLLFLRSRFGLFLIFVAILFVGVWFFGRHQIRDRQAARMAPQAGTHVNLGQVSEPLEKGFEGGVPRQAALRHSAQAGGLVPFNPPSAKPMAKAGPEAVPAKPKKVRYESLLASYEAPPASAPALPPPPKRFIPFGTLLKCKLVNTVDSADIETPVIALLLEDVWQDGELVVPANTLVHGTARAGRIRDRINAAGPWRFVWQDGRELAFTGVALDREYDQDVNGYGITDGSAGLKGRVMATDDFQELKMLAAAAMSGFAQGTQDRIVNGYGVTIPGSVTNGLWQGAGTVFQTYAQRTLQDIQQNGNYVRIAAGKEFYVYVVGTVDPDKAKIGGAPVLQSAIPAAMPAAAKAILTTNSKG